MFRSTRHRFTAYVVFQGADHRRFWRVFTQRGWRHCWLVIPVYDPEPGLKATEHSLIIDPRINFAAADVAWLPADEVAKRMMDEGATVVIKYPVDTADFRNYVPRGFITCVSLIKTFLGIEAFFVLTPKSLARWLLKNGGSIFKG